MKDKKIGFVVPQISLRKTLKEIFRGIYGLKASDVISPSEVVSNFMKNHKKYDILLVDEAHRLRKRKNITNYQSHDKNNKRLELPKDATELDWILKCCKCPVLFYDEKQVIGPAGVEKDTLENKVKTFFHEYKEILLQQQMRSQGGVEYIESIKNILQMGDPKKKAERIGFSNYEFAIVEDFSTFNDLMFTYNKKYGLVRMMAGYAWEWKSKKNPNDFDIEIEIKGKSEGEKKNINKRWNSILEDWIASDNSINEVGSIHTVQGYDLNYGFVILGNDIVYKKGSIEANRDSYFDAKGKNTATQEELTEYIKNIYYVLMTRGIKGTYLYVCDKALRDYLKQYISVYSANL